MGPVRFITFYVAVGRVQRCSHAPSDPISHSPDGRRERRNFRRIGAYLLLFPSPRADPGSLCRDYICAGRCRPRPMVRHAGLERRSELGHRKGGGVAFFAHVGGFVAGMLLIRFFKRSDIRFFAPQRETRL